MIMIDNIKVNKGGQKPSLKVECETITHIPEGYFDIPRPGSPLFNCKVSTICELIDSYTDADVAELLAHTFDSEGLSGIVNALLQRGRISIAVDVKVDRGHITHLEAVPV